MKPLDVLYALRLESGSRWGEVAADFQKDDAEAIFAEGGPRSHYVTRPRGASKTSDIAGVALSWLATEAPMGARGSVVASSADQAAILIDAAAGFVARTPELRGAVTVENERLLAPNGAWVRVLTADGSSAWGLRGQLFLIVDEFGQWPETRNAKRVWSAVLTSKQKTPGCRLIILTSAGEPSHFSYEVLTEARRERQRDVWRVSETPGPVPWVDQRELESQRFMLTDSEFSRLHMNQWTESDDRLVSPEDLAAAAVLDGPLDPKPGVKYLVTVDIGVTNDATVACVAHAEAVGDDARGPQRVVVDRLARWKGSRRKPVQLGEVEAWLTWASAHYHRAEVAADPSQAVGMVQRLNGSGVRAREFAFTSTSVGQIGSALALALRNHQLQIPNDPDLLDELSRVRLRETSPGVVRLDHDRSGHDDQAVTIGMACHLLLGKSGPASGAAWLAWAKEQIAQNEQEAETPQRNRRPFLIGQGPPESTPPRYCKEKRYGFDGLCWNCGGKPEDHK
jgi:hypothetical protein